MRQFQWRTPAGWVLVLLPVGTIALFGGLYTLLGSHNALLSQLDQVASISGVIFGALSLAAALLLGLQRQVPEPALDGETPKQSLSRQVSKEHQRLIDEVAEGGGPPLPLLWISADTDTTQFIAVQSPRDRARSFGGIDALVLLFQHSGGRLVIAGPKGAGKSVLAARLAQGLLAEPGSPHLPVAVSVLGWHPERQSVLDWLTQEILRRYPGPGIRPADVRRLLQQDAILPIVDDFDEMPPKLRTIALTAVVALCSRAVLVSHDEVWLNQHHPARRLWPDVVVVQSITARCGADYLRLGGQSDPLALAQITHLSSVLRTPLEYDLARRRLGRIGVGAWGPASDRPARIDVSLAEEALDRAYGAGPGAAPSSDRRRTYLLTIARFAEERLGGISWWRLHHLLPEWIPRLVFGVLVALTAAALCWAARGEPASGFITLFAGAAGSVLALPVPPRHLRARRLSVPVVLSGCGGLAAYLADASSIRPYLLGASTLGAAGALVMAGRIADPDLESCARTLLRHDLLATAVRAAAIATMVVVVSAGADALGYSTPAVFQAVAVLAGFTWCVIRSACGWYLAALAILAAARRLPLRLLTFLEDARRRGVLRRVGPAYEIKYPFLAAGFTGDRPSRRGSW
ncbi:hypothetical protein AB0B85_17080 [Micromonospora sp. NPDC049044]|uniref:hypothetical protein n=1 Tax=Micromonospora sp. NPDC049044 TaxID=3154827 RepID=UPI0033E82E27